ncbi:MAG: hypothetical protein JW803_05120 [Endomicrobiales bacterium]|nr:hypothetical protein [Endomicrobiales bacterium]
MVFEKKIVNKSIIAMTCIFTCLFLGLALNAYYQANKYYWIMLPKNHMAVFLTPTSPVSADVIKEKIINLEGIKKIQFVPSKTVLEKVLKSDSKIKDVIITGNNPFSSYFVIYPKKTGLAAALRLRTLIASFDGVSEVRFDTNLFSLTEELFNFVAYYRALFKICLAVLAVIVLMRILTMLLYRKYNYMKILSLTVQGLLFGVVAAGIYSLLSANLFQSGILQLPAKYLLSMLVLSLIVTFIIDEGWE